MKEQPERTIQEIELWKELGNREICIFELGPMTDEQLIAISEVI